jgi:spoIIIJ-associated protein
VAKAAAKEPSRRNKESRPAGSQKEEAVGEALSLEEQGESAREFVAGLIQELGLPATVSARVIDEETAEVSVEGKELGVLIGPGGATLGALQELARTFVQKRTGGQSSRILVDVAGYRAKRAAALQRFAKRISEEVSASGVEQALEPMSAADRKVVHDTVNELEGLVTRSEGEEPRRFIVISPQKATAEGTDDA